MFHPRGPTFLELMQQALVSTERGYDLLAPKFEHTPFRTPDGVLAGLARVIGGAGAVGSALDVCCGTGAALRFLEPLAHERVVGLDFSEGMLAEARRILPGRVELIRGDALALPFEAEMDVVTSVGAFGHILPKDEDRFVSGIARALRPGGRFVFATSHPPTPRDRWWWLAHGFNAVMRARNAILKPEFIMYYRTFEWPSVRALLERHGLEVTLHEGACEPPYERVPIVSGKKR